MRSGESDIRLLVHQSQAGAIIGKGGSKIKELREVTVLHHTQQYCTIKSHRTVRTSQIITPYLTLQCLHHRLSLVQ